MAPGLGHGSDPQRAGASADCHQDPLWSVAQGSLETLWTWNDIEFDIFSNIYIYIYICIYNYTYTHTHIYIIIYLCIKTTWSTSRTVLAFEKLGLLKTKVKTSMTPRLEDAIHIWGRSMKSFSWTAANRLTPQVTPSRSLNKETTHVTCS
jgi:hypothetical protein